jgi:MFS family permease
MLTYPLNKLIHLRHDAPDGIAAIYINSALRTLAVSLVGIFLPVFLFLETQRAFGQGIHIGFYGIVFYFLLQRLVVAVLLIPAGKFISKFGFRWSILFANVFLAILLGLFSLADKFLWVVPIAAVASGFQISLYWLSRKTLFARDGILSNLGREVGLLTVFTRITSIAGPVLGGVIITTWGFSALFIIALIIVILSGVPFFFMSKHKHKISINLESTIKWLRNKKHRNEELSFLGRHIDGFVYALFWPVFIYTILEDFEKQGLVVSLGLVASTIVVYLAGIIFDKKHSERVFRFGVFASSAMWVLRGLVRSFSQLVVVETSSNAISPLYWVTFDSLVYERARDEDEEVLVFMIGRELVVSLAMFVVLVVAFIVAKSNFRFWALWIMALLGTLSTVFMWERKNETK